MLFVYGLFAMGLFKRTLNTKVLQVQKVFSQHEISINADQLPFKLQDFSYQRRNELLQYNTMATSMKVDLVVVLE